MVIVVYYLTIKFLTSTRIGFIKADLQKARECQVRDIELTEKRSGKVTIMKIRDVNTSQIPLKQFDYREEFLKP